MMKFKVRFLHESKESNLARLEWGLGIFHQAMPEVVFFVIFFSLTKIQLQDH